MPNRDQRRRDGMFEYVQLDLAPASDEPARCDFVFSDEAACRCALPAAHAPGHACQHDCPGPAASGTPDGGS